MTQIGPDNDVLTVIFEFDVEPEEQQPLRESFERVARDVLGPQPGFISANLHVSRDGRKVLNYLQWESLEAFERFRDDQDQQGKIRPAIGSYGPKPRVYDIVFAAHATSGPGRDSPADQLSVEHSIMERERYLEIISENGAAIAAAVQAAPDAPVPSCPDWRMRDLGFHVGSVTHSWADNVRGTTPDAGAQALQPPHDDMLEAFVRTETDALVKTLAAADDDTAAWTWWGDATARWIPRRNAHETAVHRWDAENALGAAQPIDADLAADGIVEFFDVMMPWTGEPPTGLHGTIRLEPTDTASTWSVHIIDRQLPSLQPESTDAQATMRGSAADLLLVLWRRLTPDAIDLSGDIGLIKEFLAYPLLQARRG